MLCRETAISITASVNRASIRPTLREDGDRALQIVLPAPRLSSTSRNDNRKDARHSFSPHSFLWWTLLSGLGRVWPPRAIRVPQRHQETVARDR